jgi:hypothetical protein
MTETTSMILRREKPAWDLRETNHDEHSGAKKTRMPSFLSIDPRKKDSL